MCCYVSFGFEAVSCGTGEEGWEARDVDIGIGNIIAGVAGMLLTITLGWEKARKNTTRRWETRDGYNAYGRRRRRRRRRRNQSQGYIQLELRALSSVLGFLLGRSLVCGASSIYTSTS